MGRGWQKASPEAARSGPDSGYDFPEGNLAPGLFCGGFGGEFLEREAEQLSDARVLGSCVPLKGGALARADAHRNLPVGIVIRVVSLEIILVEREADHLACGLQTAASAACLDF